MHFCIANYLQKLQFKRNDRKDVAEVRKISGKLYGGYRHLLERSVPFRMVKWRNWSASLGAWLLISDFYFSMLTTATGPSLGTLTLSDLPFLFTLNTHTGKFNKLSKQQYSQVQGDLDTWKKKKKIPLTSQHLFSCTCPTDNKRNFIYGSANTRTFTEVMTLGNNLFKKVNKCIYSCGVSILFCLWEVLTFVQSLLKLVGFLWCIT